MDSRLLLNDDLIEHFIHVAGKKTDVIIDCIELIAIMMDLTKHYPDMTLDERCELVYGVVERIAAGPDGVLGTADDLANAKIIEELRVLIHMNVLQSIIQVVAKSKKQELVVNVISRFFKYVVKGALPCCW